MHPLHIGLFLCPDIILHIVLPIAYASLTHSFVFKPKHHLTHSLGHHLCISYAYVQLRHLAHLARITISQFTTVLLGDPKKYSCLVKCKMHDKKEIFKIETFFNYQWANLNFDILFVIFGCHLAEI